MPSKDDKLRCLISEQAAEWHAIQGEGPLGSEQARELMRWLQTSPLHVAEYLSIAELERDVAEVARADTASLESLVEDAAQVQWLTDTARWPRRDGSAMPDSRRATSPAHNRRTWKAGWAFALAGAVLVMVALAGWYWLGSASTTEAFTTARGQELTTYLPDHSLVRLDAESRIVVHFNRTRREVTVERGQAYFEVAANPGRPFGVRAGPVSIKDIGTKFNVYRHSAATTITVVEGHVRVSDSAALTSSSRPLAGSPVGLGPGEQVTVSDTGRVLTRGPANTWQALAWMHGRITFEGMPIAKVASRFNRYNATQIRVADPSIGAIRITGTFQSHSVASFVRFLESQPGVAVRTRGGQITVESAPRRK